MLGGNQEAYIMRVGTRNLIRVAYNRMNPSHFYCLRKTGFVRVVIVTPTGCVGDIDAVMPENTAPLVVEFKAQVDGSVSGMLGDEIVDDLGRHHDR